MQHNDEEDDSRTKEWFLINVHELQRSGKWTNDAADFLPLALADWTQRPINIFTSNQQKPVSDVLPTAHVGTNHQNAITLAFFSSVIRSTMIFVCWRRTKGILVAV